MAPQITFIRFPWEVFFLILEQLRFTFTGRAPRDITVWQVPAVLTWRQRLLLRRSGVAVSRKRGGTYTLWLPSDWRRQQSCREGWRIIDEEEKVWIRVSRRGRLEFLPAS